VFPRTPSSASSAGHGPWPLRPDHQEVDRYAVAVVTAGEHDLLVGPRSLPNSGRCKCPIWHRPVTARLAYPHTRVR
jgi:hypothetical protein